MSRAWFYDVHPRYTAGSPAAVDHQTAERVEQQERDAYQHALDGAYGETEQAKARELGLAGIVLVMDEKAKGWEVFDRITGETSFWPHHVKCSACKQRVGCRRGVVEEHRYQSGRYMGVCAQSGTYKGQKVRRS